MDVINDWLRKTYKLAPLPESVKAKMAEARERIECADGFNLSVQAGECLYCSPRITFEGPYTEVEVGFPSQREELLMEYAEDADKPTETEYGYVPVEVVNAVIAAHGGMK